MCILFHTAICGLGLEHFGLGLGLATDGLGLGTAGLDYKSGFYRPDDPPGTEPAVSKPPLFSHLSAL